MTLLYSNIVSPAFAQKVISLSPSIDLFPDAPMFVMKNESGLNAAIVNSIGCSGLIQFCPDIPGGDYKTIGGTQYKLSFIASMSPEAQLDLVFQYWKDVQKQYGSFSSWHDLYLATFYPYAIGQKDNYILGSEKSMSYAKIVAQQNKVFDVDKDSVITKAEFKQALDNKVKAIVPESYWDLFFKKKVFSVSIKQKYSLAA